MKLIQFLWHVSLMAIRTLSNFRSTKKSGEITFLHLEKALNGYFEKTAFEKASKFQAVQQLFINDSFCQLIDRYSLPKEQTLNRYYFALTGVYDDILDESSSDQINRLDQLLQNPSLELTTNFNERVLVFTHNYLLQNTTDLETYTQIIQCIHQAQKDSLKQFSPTASLKEIMDISLRKGGFSLRMCQSYLDLPLNKEMNDCWYHLGGLIQLTNDLYDIYKDTHAGIQTFCNTLSDMSIIQKYYEDQINLCFNSLQQLPYSAHKIKALKIKLSFIPAFGYLALQNLKNIQDNNTQLPAFNTIDRKLLIIDMEKPSSILKLIREAYKIVKAN